MILKMTEWENDTISAQRRCFVFCSYVRSINLRAWLNQGGAFSSKYRTTSGKLKLDYKLD